MKMASAGGDPDGSPRLHDEAPCRWLAGGRDEPVAGWLDPAGSKKRRLTSCRPCRIVRFSLTRAILWLTSKLSRFFSWAGVKMASPEPIGAADADARPAMPSSSAALPPAGPAADAGSPPLEISSEALLGGRTEVRIRHRGEIYRLTLTRAGKLILHK